ncbi:unnamed protein product [Ranitomeya imitator]|uniref:Uncharacterized protein n=1 Tax=Ranitomeya imitator TaxID=111125 RepID=A0ABN9LDN1_9NEOB|nr:unnamed protein product [Ranitomeya imitator]
MRASFIEEVVLRDSDCSGCRNQAGFWGRMKDKKMVIWTRSLLRDYKEACKDIVVGARERPFKASVYLSLLAGDSFRCSLLEASSSLLLLSPWMRSGTADGHVQRLLALSHQGRLRHAPYDPDCDLYNTQCPHLRPRMADFPGRVLDVGFFGQWWLLRNKMKDFDINEDEFSHLPPCMKTIAYNDLHSEENEKLYEIKFQPVVMCEDHQ